MATGSKATGRLIRAAFKFIKRGGKRGNAADRAAQGKMNRYGLEHVFHGHNKPGAPKGSGYHHRPGGNDMPGRRVDLSNSNRYPNGVYTGRTEYFDPTINPPNGGWKPKSGNGGVATFFPDDWPPQRVDQAIADAYKNSSPKPGGNNQWVGSADGVRIEGFYRPTFPHGYSHGWPTDPQ